MLPSAPDGSLAITLSLPRCLLMRGMRVVVEVETGLFILKRVGRVENAASLRLTSDNPDTRSRYCDVPVEKHRVVGVVVWLQPGARHVERKGY